MSQGMVPNKRGVYKFGAFMWESHAIILYFCECCDDMHIHVQRLNDDAAHIDLSESEKRAVEDWLVGVDSRHWQLTLPHAVSIQGDAIEVPREIDAIFEPDDAIEVADI